MIYRTVTIETSTQGLHKHTYELVGLTADDIREVNAFANAMLDKLIKRIEEDKN